MMVLSLIDPVGSNFIKDFPAQNAKNLDDIDAYAGQCLRTQALIAFTPQLTADTTNPTLGTGGTISGYYYRIFDQIYLWGDFRFGTAGINAGSGIYNIVLPFTINDLLGGDVLPGRAPVVGVASLWDNNSNAGKLPLNVEMRTPNTLMFNTRINSGIGARHLTNGGYITWDFQDGLNWSARFQRSP